MSRAPHRYALEFVHSYTKMVYALVQSGHLNALPKVTLEEQ